MRSSWWYGLAAAFVLQAIAADLLFRGRKPLMRKTQSAMAAEADGDVVIVGEEARQDKSNTLSLSIDADGQAASLVRRARRSSVHSSEGQAELEVQEEHEKLEKKEGQKHVEKDEDEDESEDVETAHGQDDSKKDDSKWIHASSPEHRTQGLIEEFSNGTTQGCESNYGRTSRNSACIVLRGSGDQQEVLLVYVPYGGRSKGWDLPGGKRDHGEPACKVAERETCEETKYEVRVVGRTKLNYVFKCELTRGYYEKCRKAKDEGFLRKDWYKKSQLGSLRWRSGTWGGNKAQLIRDAMGGGGSGGPDACGCKSGEGWSSGSNKCMQGSTTDSREAEKCKNGGGGGQPDACGCKSGEGWSSGSNKCMQGSTTDSREAEKCKRGGGGGGGSRRRRRRRRGW